MSSHSQTLWDLCDRVDYGYTAAASDAPVGPKFLRITDIRKEGLDWTTVPHVATDRQTLAKYRLDHGDVVVARTGAFTGHNAYVKNPPEAVFASYLVRLKAGPKLDPYFLYLFMQSQDYIDHVEAVLGGSAQPNASAKALTAAPLDPPPLDEQRAIAEVLGALDDKIELNRQMNHTLEDMASALFKSWFVDFDPVVAKAEGRKPFGMDAATAALFPSSFDDAMPRGWTAGSVGDLVELQRGFDLPEPLRSPGKVPVMAAGGFHGYHNKAMVEAPGIVTGRSGKIGDVYWVDSPYWPLNTTLWVKRLLNGAGPAFAYHLLRTLDLAALNVGSAVPSLNRNDVHPLSAVVPSRAVLSRFEETVRDWFALRQQNQAESRTLAALRDALLPKLLSGEVRLKQAEKAVEAAL